jgi:hypothetical protein
MAHPGLNLLGFADAKHCPYLFYVHHIEVSGAEIPVTAYPSFFIIGHLSGRIDDWNHY